ncbi:hypothetical protein ATANTOWER_032749 [Ataeniobius toweri]|uniref:Uncharacterized protein n=1 Tax=Ataeniobius toweri TaxID=208326 RepID=A0ABU7BVC9_9TELE|nr:hypothetical protein [Ataeniobius toweri]
MLNSQHKNWDKSIHPFSIPKSSAQGHQGAGVHLQRSTGERQGTPWTGRQAITGQQRDTRDKQPCTHPVIKPEYTDGTHACTGRTCKLHAERPLAGSQTEDLLAARQQCYQLPTVQPKRDKFWT